ncbi:MAG TPA: hypothetical protein VHP11_10355 [Tepidisphaeraceae bacterium]|nr:hypothetical protein [Tepidisphaeraceae bacterium]
MNWKVICGIVGLMVGTAQAQNALTADHPEPAAEAPAEQLAKKEQEAFSKGSWAVELWGSYINNNGISDDDGNGGTGNLGLGYYFADRWGIYAAGTKGQPSKIEGSALTNRPPHP